ncbi:MAG: MFS transporter [Rhodospirillales bacterium]|nr:MAG: MFS transporter [Rhodospirillales bacterium]
MLFLGFSAGVPILLVFSTLSVWLREAEVERATIGFFSWAALAYGFKVVWAPVVDRLPLPVLGRLLGKRRSWLLLAQASIIAALLLQAFNDPADHLALAAVFAVMLGFSSATQDIVIDAYRIEAADPEMQGLMSAAYIAGYRVGMIAAGAGALQVAGIFDPDTETYQHLPWLYAYIAMACVMGIGVVTTLVIPEPARAAGESEWTGEDYLLFLMSFAIAATVFALVFWLTSGLAAAQKVAMVELGLVEGLAGFLVEAVRLAAAVGAAVLTGVALVLGGVVPRQMAVETYVAPFADFLGRFGRVAILILALVATYRIADIVMGVMANVFYVDLGFEKQEIGWISGGFGLAMTIVGSFIGGLLILRYGILRILFVGGLLAAGTNVLFAFLATQGNVLALLIAVIAADNLSGGVAAAAFVAYLSSLTSARFTATQYALFSSIMLLLPKLIAGYSGMVVDAVGYAPFFIGTACLGVPVLVMIAFVARLTPNRTDD